MNKKLSETPLKTKKRRLKETEMLQKETDTSDISLIRSQVRSISPLQRKLFLKRIQSRYGNEFLKKVMAAPQQPALFKKEGGSAETAVVSGHKTGEAFAKAVEKDKPVKKESPLKKKAVAKRVKPRKKGAVKRKRGVTKKVAMPEAAVQKKLVTKNGDLLMKNASGNVLKCESCGCGEDSYSSDGYSNSEESCYDDGSYDNGSSYDDGSSYDSGSGGYGGDSGGGSEGYGGETGSGGSYESSENYDNSGAGGSGGSDYYDNGGAEGSSGVGPTTDDSYAYDEDNSGSNEEDCGTGQTLQETPEQTFDRLYCQGDYNGAMQVALGANSWEREAVASVSFDSGLGGVAGQARSKKGGTPENGEAAFIFIGPTGLASGFWYAVSTIGHELRHAEQAYNTHWYTSDMGPSEREFLAYSYEALNEGNPDMFARWSAAGYAIQKYEDRLVKDLREKYQDKYAAVKRVRERYPDSNPPPRGNTTCNP